MTHPTTNVEILRAMLDNGRKEEALQWLESAAQHLSPDELVPLQKMALAASAKRKRGGAGHVRDEFADMVREFAFANAVRVIVDDGATVEIAVGDVARDGVLDPNKPSKRIYRSDSAIRGYYNKWNKRVKLNEPPFD